VLVVVEVVTVAAVVFAVAALAVGRFDRMSAAPADAPFAEPLPRGPVSSADVRAARFGMSLRGYRMAEVDAVLARLADELAWRDEELARRDIEIVKLAEFARLGQPPTDGAGGPGPPADGHGRAEGRAGDTAGALSEDVWPSA
jgi:DivIVA domain-containing protein